MNRNTAFALSIVVIIGMALVYNQVVNSDRNYQYHGSLFDPFPPAHQFELLDQYGNIFRMEDQKGKVVLLFFGYANCPDVCPATLSKFKRIHAALEDHADRAVFVFITVDPERDSSEKIGAYLNAFNSAFIGLSGTRAELQPVWEGYYVYQEKEEVDDHTPADGGGYLVGHTSRIYVVDRDGNLYLNFTQEILFEDMTADILHLLGN